MTSPVISPENTASDVQTASMSDTTSPARVGAAPPPAQQPRPPPESTSEEIVSPFKNRMAQLFSWKVDKDGYFICIEDGKRFPARHLLSRHMLATFGVGSRGLFMDTIPIDRMLLWTFRSRATQGNFLQTSMLRRNMRNAFPNIDAGQLNSIATFWLEWIGRTFCDLADDANFKRIKKPPLEEIYQFISAVVCIKRLKSLEKYWQQQEHAAIIPGQLHTHFNWYVDRDGVYRSCIPNITRSASNLDELREAVRLAANVSLNENFHKRISMKALLEAMSARTLQKDEGTDIVDTITDRVQTKLTTMTRVEIKSIVMTFVSWMQGVYGGKLHNDETENLTWEIGDLGGVLKFLEAFGVEPAVQDVVASKQRSPKRSRSPASDVTSDTARVKKSKTAPSSSTLDPPTEERESPHDKLLLSFVAVALYSDIVPLSTKTIRGVIQDLEIDHDDKKVAAHVTLFKQFQVLYNHPAGSQSESKGLRRTLAACPLFTHPPQPDDVVMDVTSDLWVINKDTVASIKQRIATLNALSSS